MTCICGKETSNKKYCSRSCASTANNKLYPKRKSELPLEWSCNFCGIAKRATCKQAIRKFCSNKCQMDYQHKQSIKEWINEGKKVGVRVVKRYLEETFGCLCSCCGLDRWQGNPIALELDHIDGNSSNNIPVNLRLLCPNCHSQTETFKGKNRGRGRANRRVRYKEGKSY
jgi:hypothetical protein